MEYQALVVAAGNGNRSQLQYNKIFYQISNRSIFEWAIQSFIQDQDCTKIVIVIRKSDEKQIKQIIQNEKVCFVYGGSTRQESVRNGLKEIHSQYLLVHDGARPFLTMDLIQRIKDSLLVHAAVIPVIAISDSIKQVKEHKVLKSLDRNEYRFVQTPQGFLTNDLKKAHEMAENNMYSDDSIMIEQLLHQEVFCVDGEISNKKFTCKEDF